MMSDRAYFSNPLAREFSSEAERAANARYNVVCVSGGYGYPFIGTSARIVTVGRALQATGVDFRVLHFGPSPAPNASGGTGVYRGIPFEYTCEKRPENIIARWLVYTWAVAGLTVRLWRLRGLRERSAVYLYLMDGPLCLYIGLLCRLLGFPVVQEMCEWPPTISDGVSSNARPCSAFNRWFYRKPIFSMATGVLVISRSIERRVRERASAAKLRLLVHRLTSVVDSQPFVAAPEADHADEGPHFLWCGVGYPKDVRFLVRVLARANREGYRCKLRIISAAYTVWSPEQILNYAEEQGLSRDAIILMGRVDDQTLASSYRSATALLLPLWDDDRSRTRMPNKLSEYLASGRPIITCKVGDLLDYLVDDVNAYLVEPGNEDEFFEKMSSILRSPDKATRIGAAGQVTCLAQLDYRLHAKALAKFFVNCIEYSTSQDRGKDGSF